LFIDQKSNFETGGGSLHFFIAGHHHRVGSRHPQLQVDPLARGNHGLVKKAHLRDKYQRLCMDANSTDIGKIRG